MTKTIKGGISMATKIIDISSYQKSVDFNKVKASGVTGVILRAGYTGYGSAHTMCKDDMFESHYKGAIAAGLDVGAYYYSGALTEDFAVKEANYFLSIIKGKTFSLPVYMDVEETHSTTNMPGLGKTKLTAVVTKWCDTVEKAGYFTGFYTAKSWCGTYLDMNKLSRFTFWLAHWVSKTDYKGAYALWQYTSDGSIPGISGRVDTNYCYEDFRTLIKSLGLNGYKKESDKRYRIEVYGATAKTMPIAVEALKKAGFTAKVSEI